MASRRPARDVGPDLAPTRSPRWWSLLATGLALLLVLEDSSRQVAPDPLLLCAVAPLALAVIADYLWRMLRHHEQSGAARQPWRWAVAPVALLVAASAWASHWPLLVRFALSRPAFERALRSFSAAGRFEPQWVGWFPVAAVVREPDGAAVNFVVGNSVADPVAIRFDPGAPREHALRLLLDGAWYATEL